MQQLLSPQHLILLLVVALYFFRPKNKPPVHPIPAGDSALLRRIRSWRKTGLMLLKTGEV